MPYDVKKSGKKMKKTIGVAMAAACVASVQMAQAQTTLDTLKVQNLHEVVVKGVRAPKNAPFAVANIKSGELQKFATSGKEMPFLIQPNTRCAGMERERYGHGNYVYAYAWCRW